MESEDYRLWIVVEVWDLLLVVEHDSLFLLWTRLKTFMVESEWEEVQQLSCDAGNERRDDAE